MIHRILQAYCLFVFLWFLSNRFMQDSWWGIVVLDKFAAYFLFASIPLFLLSIATRKKSTITIMVVPLLVGAFFYLPFFHRLRVPVTPSAQPVLRVSTYNIWNHNKELESIAKVINNSLSDVIAIQEITETQRFSLIDLLTETYPYYYVSKPIYGGTTAIFSQHTLLNVVELDFDIDRPAVIADFEWHGELISIASAHLNPSFWAYQQQPLAEIPGNYHRYIMDQNRQASMIIDALVRRTRSTARLLACDCNSQETASTNRLLASFFKDTLKTIGWQLGDPPDPLLSYERNLGHIDYIWYAGDLKPEAIYRIKDTAGSDHHPIVADFYLLKTLR